MEGEPKAWWEELAEGWERIANRLEAKPKGDASPTATTNNTARAVAVTAKSLAAGLRAAARRADTGIGNGQT